MKEERNINRKEKEKASLKKNNTWFFIDKYELNDRNILSYK